MFSADDALQIPPSFLEISSRRDFLLKNGICFGGLGLASLLGISSQKVRAAEVPLGPLAPKPQHFKAKAKAVIQIFAAGGPSQMDSWDPKPELQKNDGKKIPGYNGLALGSKFKFSKMGQSGIEVSDAFPALAKCVDDMAIIRSLQSEVPDHAIAHKAMMTGSLSLPRPSLGSWITYGLGTVNQSLPGYITMGGNNIDRQPAFLPGLYGGCNVNYSTGASLGDILPNITSAISPTERQRNQIDFARELNRMEAQSLQRDIQLETRIQAFEIAYTMQSAAVEAFDISRETGTIRDLYTGGLGKKAAGLADKLLVARRLVERGVRYVQVSHAGWDNHVDIHASMGKVAGEIDHPAAALLKDLKQRGLLESTLVIWGGEIGRTPTIQGSAGALPGRDHNGQAVSWWMAGGGIKGGTVYGATDEFGGRAVENKVSNHDLHATILALMGLDHTKLTYNYNGRDFRLTDNFGTIISPIIA